MEADRLDPKLSTLGVWPWPWGCPLAIARKSPEAPAWGSSTIDALVREAVADKRLVSPMARSLRSVARERLAASGRRPHKRPGTGERVIHQLKADLGPALWNAVVARLDKFR